MSDKFVNGLKLTTPTASQCGRTFSRWLVEWLTQVCGWTIHDAVSGNWSNVAASGVDGASRPTHNRFTATAGFSASTDIGAYLTITGFTGRFTSRDGIYRISKVISASEVELDTEHSVHEDGFPDGVTGLTWRLWRPTATYVPTSSDVVVLKGRGTTGSGYDFHLHITVTSSNSYFPEFRISPFASWNASTHAWSDLRYTSAMGLPNWNNSNVNVDNCRVWGAADADRTVIMIRMEDDYYAWHFLYLGEMDTFHPTQDPKPCIMWSGSNRGSSSLAGDNVTLIGTSADSNINGRGVWLAADDLTTVNGYLMFDHCAFSSDTHWLAGEYRRFGESRRYNYLLDLVCECRTSGQMEMRGKLRRCWTSSRDHRREKPFGANSEYLHVIGGFTIPWMNTKTWYQR